ncbi:MAG: elongation factor G [Planctomycetes bacterium]|nr:elongation factor G [Planctomycetota bacterium]
MAHIDAGKTTTTEQILFYSGKQHRIGSVDEGNTTTDYLPQERERGITIVAAPVTTHWTPPGGEQHRINIIDTPGHIDFTAEVERSLSVLDGAIGVFCGVAGVQAQSETVWRQATRYRVPRMAYVNKLDRSGASFYEALQDIEARLVGMTPLAVQVPIGAEKEFRGVVDLLTMRAWTWAPGDPPPPPVEGDIPEEVQDEAQLYREQLIERLADLDAEVGNRFLEEQEMDAPFLRAALRRVTLALKAFPVLCGASFRQKGVQPLLDAICHYLPSPTDRPAVKGKRPKSKRGVKTGGEDVEDWLEAERNPSPTAPFCALAFKTISSPTSEMCYLRIYSGTSDGSDQLLNVRGNKKERLGKLYIVDANKKSETELATAGDIVGVIGLRFTRTGDTLCDPDSPILLGAITFPLPVVSMAVEPKSTADRDKLNDAIGHMAKDDPTFHVRQDAETGQTLISGMGELHLDIIADRLKREWNVEAKIGKPRVSYKQTVRGTARAEHKVDMEVAGKRQFGHVVLELAARPGAPGGVTVDFDLDEAVLPDEFRPGVEDAIRSKASGIGDYGDPLIDVAVRVTGGSFHPTDSVDSAYAMAASRALDAAAEDAGLVSLEPVMTLQVEVPEDLFGTVLQDVQARRGEILESTAVRDLRRIVAAVPLAEMFGYASDIRSKTQGRADFTLEPRTYAIVPEGKRPKLF